MTAVLLIADSERVQRIFADLESKGVLQLHAAATLDQADQELRATFPALTFVQSRISGLSTGILLRHLKKRLPESADIVLLYSAAADLQPNPSTALPPVDLRVTDEVLGETIAGMVTGRARPLPANSGKAANGENEAKRTPRQEKGARRQERKGERADAQEQADATSREERTRPGGKAKNPQVKVRAPLAQGAKQAPAAQEAKQAPAADVEQPEQTRPEQSAEAVEPPPEQGTRRTENDFTGLPLPFGRLPVLNEAATAPAEAVTAAPPMEPAPAGEPAVTEVPAHSFRELVQSASARRGVGLPSAPLPTEESGEAAAAERAGNKKPMWPFLLLLAFLLIPSAGYLLGRISAAPEQEARQEAAGASQRSALYTAATSATARTLSRAATATARKGVQPQEAPQASGVATLPPFLEGVELDRGYGERHPGWERYLGSTAEYRLFRESGRYRAIQAIARADEIPDQLFKRVLLEFGAIAGYAVKSSEQKGEYLVEQAATSGSAALTIYRKMNDRRIRGLVVYYR